MNRRTFLTASGTALATPIAGCLSDSNENSNANTSANGNNGRNTQEGEIIEEDPRADIPPHEINTPEVKDHDDFDPNDWNDDYLGEHMEQEPSLSFDVLLQSSSNMTILEDELEWNEGSYQTKLVANKNDYKEVFNLDGMDEETQEQLTAIDFNESVLVVVESGWDSSSVQQQWARVMDVEEGLYLHGYYTRPYEVTSDLAPQLSVLEIERPTDELELARVSLTVSEDRRVHFNSTEGVVTVDEDEKSECPTISHLEVYVAGHVPDDKDILDAEGRTSY